MIPHLSPAVMWIWKEGVPNNTSTFYPYLMQSVSTFPQNVYLGTKWGMKRCLAPQTTVSYVCFKTDSSSLKQEWGCYFLSSFLNRSPFCKSLSYCTYTHTHTIHMHACIYIYIYGLYKDIIYICKRGSLKMAWISKRGLPLYILALLFYCGYTVQEMWPSQGNEG